MFIPYDLYFTIYNVIGPCLNFISLHLTFDLFLNLK